MILSVGINGLANIWETTSGVRRTGGFLPIMSTAAIFGMTIPMIIILLINVKKVFNQAKYRRYSVFLFSVLILCLAGMFFNQTRISFLGVLCAFGAYFIFKFKYLNWQKKLVIIVCITVLPILLFNTNKNVLFDTSLKKENWSNALRILMWEYGWNTFKTSPLFGIGAGVLPAPEFAEKNGMVILEKINSTKYGHIHNAYLQLLVTTGIVGLVGCFLFWYHTLCKNIMTLLFNKQNKSVYSDIVLTTTVFFVVNNITDVLFTGLPMYFFCVLSSICIVGVRKEL